jgi:hypothetical protein
MAQRHMTTTTTTTTRTARPKPSLFGRRKKVVHQKRKPTLGVKVAGAAKKLKGTILGHPGEKVRHIPYYLQIPRRGKRADTEGT